MNSTQFEALMERLEEFEKERRRKRAELKFEKTRKGRIKRDE